MGKYYLLLCAGLLAGASAIVFIKASAVPPVLLASLRLLGATLVLLPAFIRALRKSGKEDAVRALRGSLLPGLALGLHFITWNMGARLTTGANATLLVNLSPVALPFIVFALARERVTRREIAGTALGLAGAVLVTARGLSLSTDTLAGSLLCLLSMILLAFYLASAKKNRDLPFWLYVVPMYAVGGLLCLAISPVAGEVAPAWTLRELGMVAALALLPTVLGHSISNFVLRHVRSQTVTLLNLCQVPIAGVLTYFLFGEIPGWELYPAAALIVVGIVVAIGIVPWKRKTGGASDPSPPPAPETPR